MRALGAELGCEAMAVYRYVENREELLEAIGERLLDSLRGLSFDDGWRDACEEFARALRELVVGNPATFALIGLRPLDTTNSLEVVERLLTVLVEHGFAPHDALAIYRAVASYARGYALAEATGFTVDGAGTAGRKRLRALPAARFPVLRGRIQELSELDPDSGFRLGLDALMRGLPEPG